MSEEPERYERLVRDLREGDRVAFDVVYDLYYERLWRFAFSFVRTRAVAQDVVHDVFLTLWTARESLDVRGSLEAYLYGAVRNCALNVVRHDRVVEREQERAAAARHSPAMGEADDDAQARLEQHELSDVLSHALARLTERQRTAVLLRWQQGMQYDEIARVLGISPQATRRLVLRVHDTLRRLVRRFL